MLELKNISKTYDTPLQDDSEYVLREIFMTVAEGEAVAIVGPSGSGKSTLLNIAGTLDRPTAGGVFLNNREVSGLDDRAAAQVRSQEIGFVFQLHHLLPQCTVLENVLIPSLAIGSDPEETESRARELLDRVNLSHRIDHRPGQLSGGERQRTAVVRALINRPKLILADEPTGSLDRTASGDLADLLAKLNKEERVTLIMVTHAMALAERMDRILELKDGRLEAKNER